MNKKTITLAYFDTDEEKILFNKLLCTLFFAWSNQLGLEGVQCFNLHFEQKDEKTIVKCEIIGDEEKVYKVLQETELTLFSSE